MKSLGKIVWSGFFLACLAGMAAGCGQRGPLYLPDSPAARQRATLPQVLLPTRPASPASAASAPALPALPAAPATSPTP
ncbi:MAG: lipoprotein [Comamonadaceae bacterium]|nr:lipoprotein [Comamonadaceae bacterium]